MLKNRFADKLKAYMDKLYEAGIYMNGQIVLCKGINDGEKLDESIKTLSQYLPYLQSVSIVPVGLTKHREGLYPLSPFNQEDAIQIIDMVHNYQKKLMASHNTHFIHLSDEFYFLAGRDMPKSVTYDDYLQLENGVGMTRLFMDNVEEALKKSYTPSSKNLSIVTGMLFYPVLKNLMDKIMERYHNIKVDVYPIENRFFGENITVSGLLTGNDITLQLKDKALGDYLILPSNLLKEGESVLLDNVTISDIENALSVKIKLMDQSGNDLISEILSNDIEEKL